MRSGGKYPPQIIYMLLRDDSDEVWWKVSTADNCFCLLGMILMRTVGKHSLQIIYLMFRDDSDEDCWEVSTADHISGV